MKLVRSVMVALAVLTAGCGHPAPSTWLTSVQVEEEYFVEAKSLQLAPGWKWPLEPEYRATASDGKQILYQVNAGRVDADWYWHCSWARTFLRAKEEPAREAALRQVLRVRESAFYKYGLLPGDRKDRDRVLNAAVAGNPAQLRAVVEGNCPPHSS